MSRKPVAQNTKTFAGRLYDSRSGLTPQKSRPDWPIIFEYKNTQDLLLRIARDGEVRTSLLTYSKNLTASGLVTERRVGDEKVLTLDPKFYASGLLQAILREMNGTPCAPIPATRGKSMKPARPLGRRSFLAFALLRWLVESDTAITQRAFGDCFPTVGRTMIKWNLDRFVMDGVLILTAAGEYSLSDALPTTFPRLIRKMGIWYDDNGYEMPQPGLSTVKSTLPVLFGNKKVQDVLIEIARSGNICLDAKISIRSLLKTGMLEVRNNPRVASLNPDHPAACYLRACLGEIGGFRVRSVKERGTTLPIERGLPGNDGQALFRVLHRLLMDGPLDRLTLARRMPDLDPMSVPKALVRLSKQNVLIKDGGGTFTFAPGVPETFKKFIRTTADWFAEEDPRITYRSDIRGARSRGFVSEADGAPLLFGTDLRLRNLMALAKYGPMLEREMRRVTGARHFTDGETKTLAPYGRGAVVRRWRTSAGMAVMLDPNYPLADHLLRLLLRLEQMYPVAPFFSAYEPLVPPEPNKWFGDKNVVFGGVITTNILLTIGVLGWTYQTLSSLVCITPVGEKKSTRTMILVYAAVTRMEREGILVADRPHGAGANARILRIAKDYPAREELLEMIHAYLKVWPGMTRTVERKMKTQSPKTQAHLRRRGLWPYN